MTYAIDIDLIGTNTATCGDLTVSSDKGPIHVLARKLIERGEDPQSLVCVLRNGLRCFEPMTLEAWAHWTIREGDKGIKRVKYVPMPDGLKGERSEAAA